MEDDGENHGSPPSSPYRPPSTQPTCPGAPQKKKRKTKEEPNNAETVPIIGHRLAVAMQQPKPEKYTDDYGGSQDEGDKWYDVPKPVRLFGS